MFRELPSSERVGAGEALILDRDTKVVRRWAHDATHLTEHRRTPTADTGCGACR